MPLVPFAATLALILASGGAADVARQSYEAMGGDSGFTRAASVEFAFTVHDGDNVAFARHHLWDRVHGRDRVEGKDKQGRDYVVVVDLATKQGWAMREGQRLEGEELTALLARAYGAWINDTYWLLMPAKLGDPGVELADEGEAEVLGHHDRKLKLSFQGVGLTPGDVYWGYFNPDTHLMEKWEFVLQGQQPPAVGFTWEDWKAVGPLTLATTRRDGEGKKAISFEQLAVTEAVDAARFTPPSE